MQQDATIVVAIDPEHGSHHFASPGADQSRETDDLTGVNCERDVFEDAAAGEVLDFQNRASDNRLRLWKELG